MSAVPFNLHAEYVCGCRSCGNHCMAIERIRSAEDADEVTYSDGYQGGWHGVQTEVVTCPHCGLAMSWRKNCVPAAQLRLTGDLGRFYLPMAGWGPAGMYWSGFQRYDELFHSPAETASAPSNALPRLTQPPTADALWALRKRGWLARGLLWLDNDRDRFDFFFGGQRPGPRTPDDARRRALLLRALLEAALFGGDASETNVIDMGEWYRELGEWESAAQVLGRKFQDRFLADRARQLQELVAARIETVMPFEIGPDLQAELERERQEKLNPPKPAKRKGPPRIADPKSPRALLAKLVEAQGTLAAEAVTRDHIPRPYGSLLRTLMKSYGWDEASFAVSVVRGLARAHGWPDDADDAECTQIEAVAVDESVLDYLATAFRRAAWDQWAFDVPSTPAPKAER